MVIDWHTEIIDIAGVDITEKSTVFQYCSFHISELVIIDWKELFFAIAETVQSKFKKVIRSYDQYQKPGSCGIKIFVHHL